jgi:hypothetical protein
LLAAVLDFCSGPRMQYLSGVTTMNRPGRPSPERVAKTGKRERTLQTDEIA